MANNFQHLTCFIYWFRILHFVYLIGIAGYDPTVGRPNIEEWLHLVRELTNPIYDEAHEVAYKIAEKE